MADNRHLAQQATYGSSIAQAGGWRVNSGWIGMTQSGRRAAQQAGRQGTRNTGMLACATGKNATDKSALVAGDSRDLFGLFDYRKRGCGQRMPLRISPRITLAPGCIPGPVMSSSRPPTQRTAQL